MTLYTLTQYASDILRTMTFINIRLISRNCAAEHHSFV